MARGNSPILKGKNKVIEGMGPKQDRNLAGQTLCSVDLHLASGHMVMRCGTQRTLWPSWLPATWPLSWAVSACSLQLSLAIVPGIYNFLGSPLQLQFHFHSFTCHPPRGCPQGFWPCYTSSVLAGLPLKSRWKPP